MKNTLKGYLIGVLSTVMLLGCVAYAASNTKTIEALYNNIKIYVDGVKIDPKDANGNTVEPFIYNGTTYLPVRAVGEAIGKTVTWDGATQSVYLGEKPGDVQYLLDICQPYANSNFDIYRSTEGKSFEMAGKKYSNGLRSSRTADALFNLDSKYSTLECVIGHSGNDTNKETISFVVDGKNVKTVELEPNCMPKNISVPLNYGLQMQIIASHDLIGYGNSFVCTVGIANMIVK